MSTFGPLHVSSHWSLDRSALAPADLARRAAAAGLDALVLTDHENLSGQVEHQHACRLAGIRPVTGLSLGLGPHRRPRLVMLAEAARGYQSLCRIVARRRARPGPDAGDPVADVLADPDGLLALSEDPHAIRALIAGGFAPDRARVLLARPHGGGAPHEERLQAEARALGVQVAAQPRLALAERDDLEVLWLHRAIRAESASRWLQDELEARRRRADALPFGERDTLFADVPAAVAQTRAVLQRCEAVDLGSAIRPPDASAPAEDAAERLACRARRALSRAAASGAYAAPVYAERLEHELGVVARMGLAGWFLAVDQIGHHLRSRRIDALARGSAAGSLLVHLFGLAAVDPVAAGLVFERFLHEKRPDPPDLDLDVPSDERDGVLAWILDRWPEHAALVASHARYRTRSAWRDALSALGADREAAASWCRRLAEDDAAPAASRLREIESSVPAPARTLLPYVPQLVGAPRHLSTHPGAVVLSASPVRDVLPVDVSPKGVPVTQYDGASLDRLGVVRLDVLGNRGLQVARRALALAAAAPDASAPDRLHDVPPDDPATYALLDAGDTMGVFQVEAAATRGVLRRRQVNDMASLTEALAAVRPGPAGGDGPLFEEDIMRDLAAAGGLSLAEADLVRASIVAAGEDPAALARLGEQFLAHAGRRSGADGTAPAHAAWARAARFGAYTFSKAHASSHALLAYRAAWLRVHHPAAFACALLDHYGGGYPLRSLASAIARWGIEILPPCVNRSSHLSTVEGAERVRLGLARLRRIPGRLRRAILAERERAGPYDDLADFVRRLQPAAHELEAVVLSGAGDALPPLAAHAYPHAHQAALARLGFGAAPARVPQGRDDASYARYRSLVRIRNELRFLGLHPSAHPLAVLRSEAADAGCARIADALAACGAGRGTPLRIAGLLAATHRLETERGVARFLTLEDETGLLEAFVPRDLMTRDAWTGGPYLVDGSFADRPDGAFRVTQIRPFHHREGGPGPAVGDRWIERRS